MLPNIERLTAIRPLSELEFAEPYSEAALQAARARTDPVADDVIAELKRSAPITSPRDMLRTVRERAPSEGGVYRRFLEECATVPEWADFERMRPGQRLIAAYAPFAGLSLLTGSLVGGYMFKKMAMVTAFTGRLGMPGDISRRLQETSALVFYMSMPGEVEPGGRAHEILVRVRLLHGAIREWIAQSGRWKTHWDEPINQEDLAITLSLFSYWNVRSLLRMGVRLSDEQIRSHHLLWRWAGHVLGIEPFLLAETFPEEVRQYHAMLKHQARPDECPPYGRKILDEVADRAPLLSPREARRFLYQVTRYLIGDELVSGLEIEPEPRYPGVALLRAIGSAWSFVHDHVPGGEAFLYESGSAQFRKQLSRMEGHDYGVRVHDENAVRRAHGLAPR